MKQAKRVVSGFLASVVAFAGLGFLNPTTLEARADAAPARLAAAKNFGGSGNDAFNSVKKTSDGGYIAVGSTQVTAASDSALLTVEDSPTSPLEVVSPPQSKVAATGSTVTFSVTASDTDANATLTYQWYQNESALSDGALADSTVVSGATSPTLTLKGVSPSDNTVYTVTVTDSDGNSVDTREDGTSALTVYDGLKDTETIITSQPQAQTVKPGSDVTFSVSAVGTELTYQWYDSNGLLTDDGAKISGSHTQTLALTNITDDDNYNIYYCEISSTVNGDITTSSSDPAEQFGQGALIVKYDAKGAVQWERYLGGSATTVFNSVAQAPDGGYIAVGYNTSDDGIFADSYKTKTPDGFPQYSNALAVRFKSDGTISWIQEVGSTSVDVNNTFKDVVVDKNSGFVAVGTLSSSQQINGKDESFYGNGDGALVKFNNDQTGSISWEKIIGGSAADDINSVSQAADGSFVFAGDTYSHDDDLQNNPPVHYLNTKGKTVYPEDGIVGGVSEDGSLLSFIRSFGRSGNDSLASVHATDDGGLVVAGYIDSPSSTNCTDNLGGLSYSPKGTGKNAVVAKYDSSHNLTWVTNVNGSNWSSFSGVQPAADGGYIAVGSANPTTGNDFGTYNVTSKGSIDGIVTKFDGSGNIRWIDSIGGSGSDQASSVVQNADGSILVAGSSVSSDGDFTGYHHNGIVNDDDATSDAFLVQLNEVPGAPTGVTADTTVPSLVTLHFTAPTDTGGSPVTGYTATATDSGGYTTTADSDGTATAIHFRGLSAGTYRFTVVAKNALGTGTASAGITATAATETAASGPTILTPPQSQTVFKGGSVTLSVDAYGVDALGTPLAASDLGYQWYKDKTPISGATKQSYTIASAAESDAGSYTVKVTDGKGSTYSEASVLTVNIPPEITTQPTNQTVEPGRDATFTVAASGSGLTYQWYQNGKTIDSTANTSAATSTLTLKSVAKSDSGSSYTVVVTGAAGASVTSSAAKLTVSDQQTLTGYVIDEDCYNRVDQIFDPGVDSRGCQMMKSCAASGYGIAVLQSDGSYKFYYFDGKIADGTSFFAGGQTGGQLAATNFINQYVLSANIPATVTGVLTDNTNVNPKSNTDGISYPIFKVNSITAAASIPAQPVTDQTGYLADAKTFESSGTFGDNGGLLFDNISTSSVTETKRQLASATAAASGYGIVVKQDNGYVFKLLDGTADSSPTGGQAAAAAIIAASSSTDPIQVKVSGYYGGTEGVYEKTDGKISTNYTFPLLTETSLIDAALSSGSSSSGSSSTSSGSSSSGVSPASSSSSNGSTSTVQTTDGKVVVNVPSNVLPDGIDSVRVDNAVVSSGATYSVIDSALSAEGYQPLIVNSITLLDENNHPVTELNGTVTVKIKVPDGATGNLKVIWYNPLNGSSTDMNAVLRDGYLVFQTNHFSYYVVAQAKTTSSSTVSGSSSSSASSTGSDASSEASNPSTGSEQLPYVSYLALGMAAVVAGAILNRKRKKQ